MKENASHLHCNLFCKNRENHTYNKIKTFISQNKPGFETEQTVPQWAQVDSTQKDLVPGCETLPVFHQGSCSHGISLSDYRCTG